MEGREMLSTCEDNWSWYRYFRTRIDADGFYRNRLCLSVIVIVVQSIVDAS